MKSVSEFCAASKPLFEGSRMSTIVKGKQFCLYKGEYRYGFIHQHHGNSYSLHLDDGTFMMFVQDYQVRDYLTRFHPTLTFEMQ